jgi:hypothetical protein
MDLAAQYDLADKIIWVIFFWGLYRLWKRGR